MTPQPAHTCARCGRQNPSRARFCAQCGLNLAAAGADEVTRAVRRNGRKTGTGLVLFLILLGLFLAAIGSVFRVRPAPSRPRMIHPDMRLFDESKSRKFFDEIHPHSGSHRHYEWRTEP